MLSLYINPTLSSSENIGGNCWKFDQVASLQGGSSCKSSYGEACSFLAKPWRNSCSEDSLNEKLFQPRLRSSKGWSVLGKNSGNASWISSALSLGVFIEGVINKRFFCQDSEAKFDHFEQLTAHNGPIPSLGSPQLERSTGPKILEERQVKNECSTAGKAVHQASLNNKRIENTRGDFSSERGNGAFVMDDGESYTSFSVGMNGLPIVCNSKGCRPLSKSERESPAYVAHVQKSANGQEMETNMLRMLEQRATRVQDTSKVAQQFYERAKLSREAIDDSFNRDLEAPSDDCVLASYAWLLWDEKDDF